MNNNSSVVVLLLFFLTCGGVYFYVSDPDRINAYFTPKPTPTPVWTAPVDPQYPSEWTTTDGHKYSHVKVTLIEADAVTIMHTNGVALIDMDVLPPGLQETFNYIPYCAQVAAAARKSTEASDDQSLTDARQANSDAATKHEQAVASLVSQINDLMSKAAADDAAVQQKYYMSAGSVTRQGYRLGIDKTPEAIEAASYRAQAAVLQVQLNDLNVGNPSPTPTLPPPAP